MKKEAKQGTKNDIGLGLKPPKEKCEEAECPWHGSLPVRGRVLGCVVVSTHGHKTAIAERSFPHYIPKYQRYERRTSRLTVHNPSCISAKAGDKVVIAECRPLSKTKHFVIVSLGEVEKS